MRSTGTFRLSPLVQRFTKKLGIKQDEIKKQFGPKGNFAEMLADLSVKDFR